MPATTSSYIMITNFVAGGNNSNAMALSSDTIKFSLHGNAGSTPTPSSDTGVIGAGSWTDQLANGNGYTTGGITLVTPNYAVNTTSVVAPVFARMLFKYATPNPLQWTSFTGAPYCGLLSDTTINLGLAAYAFGGAQTVSAGTLSLTPSSIYGAGGLFYWNASLSS